MKLILTLFLFALLVSCEQENGNADNSKLDNQKVNLDLIKHATLDSIVAFYDSDDTSFVSAKEQKEFDLKNKPLSYIKIKEFINKMEDSSIAVPPDSTDLRIYFEDDFCWKSQTFSISGNKLLMYDTILFNKAYCQNALGHMLRLFIPREMNSIKLHPKYEQYKNYEFVPSIVIITSKRQLKEGTYYAKIKDWNSPKDARLVFNPTIR